MRPYAGEGGEMEVDPCGNALLTRAGRRGGIGVPSRGSRATLSRKEIGRKSLHVEVVRP